MYMIIFSGIHKRVHVIARQHFYVTCLKNKYYVCPLQDQEGQSVSRVRVTSRSSPQKVERVSGLVARSHVDVPKVSYAKQRFASMDCHELNFCSMIPLNVRKTIL